MKLVFSNQHVSLQLFTSGPTCAYKQKYIFIIAEHDALLLELRQAKPFFLSLCLKTWSVKWSPHATWSGMCRCLDCSRWKCGWRWLASSCAPAACPPPLPSPHHSPTTTTLPSPSCHQLPLLLALALQPATSIQSWSSFYQFHPRIAPFGGDIYFIACK